MTYIPSIAVKIFAKAPLPGMAKTRLAPALGDVAAAQVAESLLACCVRLSRQLPAGMDAEFQLSPAPQSASWQGIEFLAESRCCDQGEGDLGQRLLRAAERGLTEADGVVLIGTDCPTLTVEHLCWARHCLREVDAALIPARDGGYVLLALRVVDSSLFFDIDWSTARVAEQTRRRLRAAGLSWREQAPLADLDLPSDIVEQPQTFIENCAPLARYRGVGG